MTNTTFTPEQTKALQTVEKLMRLAGKNPNENEAASATAKAMELLAMHNLDMSAIEQGGGEKSVRTDEKFTGGLYKWNRELWEAIAELNFCFYWNQYVWDKNKVRKVKDSWSGKREKKQGGYRFEHRLVGRKVNVVSTKNMAEYLEGTIERLTREKVGTGDQFFTRWATAYREGIADEVIRKIYKAREELLEQEARRRMEAELKTKEACAKGSTSTALSLHSLAKSEEDANMDFLYGEGYSAKRAAERAAWAKKQAEAEEEYTRWAKEHPEEAAAAEKKRREESRKARRTSWNAGTGRGDSRRQRLEENSGAYWAGREKGKSVSIHQQAETGKQEKIGHDKK